MVLIGEVQVFQKQRDRQTEHAYSQKSKEYKIRKIYIFRVMKKRRSELHELTGSGLETWK